MLRARVVLLCVLLICMGEAIHQIHPPNLADFEVYDTAAALVAHHRSPHIYDGADNGGDPQLKFGDPGTVFGQQAQALGIPRTRLYVYPPILADLLVPFALLPLPAAKHLWVAANLLALLASALLALGVVRGSWRSWGAAALLLGTFSLLSTAECLHWGQITIMLLLLWAGGIFAYARGWLALSATLLALATWIKLTPLLVLVPFFIWRDWKWLRLYALAMLAGAAAMVAINGPSLLPDYFLHVTPSMSRGIPNLQNKSLPSAVQVFWLMLRGGMGEATGTAAPAPVVAAGKLLSSLALFGGLAALLRFGRRLALADRPAVLAAIALLSTCISPVSWAHAYEPVILLLAVLWRHALLRPVSSLFLALLAVCSVELGTFGFDSGVFHVLHNRGPVVGLFSFAAPLSGLALVFLAAGLLRRQGAAGAAHQEAAHPQAA